jgi:hypothetical protein
MKQLFGTALTHKLVAAGIVALLAGGAAVGAFASQDKLPGQAQNTAVTQLDSTPTSTATVTATATGTETGTSTTTATVTATPSVEPEDARHGDCTTTATVTATATDTATATPTITPTTVAGGQNDDQGENDEGDNNQGENGNGKHDCDIKGIPSTNPNHHPEATPGVCQKGETVIKTTPSGEQVNVPCQAADKGDGHEGDDKNPASGR